jgi:hypothetical protein
MVEELGVAASTTSKPCRPGLWIVGAVIGVAVDVKLAPLIVCQFDGLVFLLVEQSQYSRNHKFFTLRDMIKVTSRKLNT